MPNYYNPYNFYPASYPVAGGASFNPYMNNAAVTAVSQQPYAASGPMKVMEWVEGEVGAKAYQKPAELPANQPIPLWDSTDTVIYLKSWSPMGIPNPMQKLRYEMPEPQNAMTLQNNAQSGATNSDFATKDDLNSLRDEIRGLKDMLSNRRNQNGSNNNNNSAAKGGNMNA